MTKKPKEIHLRFNIFNTGRKYTGIQRGYILDNVKAVINSPKFQERLRLREAVGYLGHGLREMAGTLTLGEKVAVKLPNGASTVVEALPSNVCTKIEIDDDGWVSHTQEIANNDEGKKLLALHNSRLGGFSWASSGGKVGENTILDDLMGFDYVHNPLYSENRGYVLDSADENDTSFDNEMIMDNLKSVGISEESASQVLDSFVASAVFDAEQYKNMFFSAQQVIADQAEQKRENQMLLDSANNANALLKQEKDMRFELFKSLQSSSLININDQVLDALQNMSSEEHLSLIKNLILDAANINTTGLPINHQPTSVINPEAQTQSEPQYGDLEYSLGHSIYS